MTVHDVRASTLGIQARGEASTDANGRIEMSLRAAAPQAARGIRHRGRVLSFKSLLLLILGICFSCGNRLEKFFYCVSILTVQLIERMGV